MGGGNDAKTADAIHPELVSGDWIVRFERRALNDIRTIVRPDPENERRFATVRRVSEINLGLYRTLLQPLVRALASEQIAEWLHTLHPSELPFELFSDRNPFTRHIAQLAEQVRQQRRAVSPDNPLLQLQSTVSERIIAVLGRLARCARSQRRTDVPRNLQRAVLPALVGIRASDKSPRRQPGIEPERIAFIRARIREIKERVAESGRTETAIRSSVYIGMTGSDVDEPPSTSCARSAPRHNDPTLEEFKRMLREQFFALILDPDGALAAIPRMISADAGARREASAAIRAVVSAAGELTGERARRLARIETILGEPAPTPALDA